jgi:hypothetical protein
MKKIYNALHNEKVKPLGLYVLLSAILLNPQGTAVISEKNLETYQNYYSEEVNQELCLATKSILSA